MHAKILIPSAANLKSINFISAWSSYFLIAEPGVLIKSSKLADYSFKRDFLHALF